MMPRVDLFSVPHKAVRTLLFELSLDVARLDVTSTQAIDALVGRLERTLEFLDEHAHHEDTHAFPALRVHAPVLAGELESDHRAMEVIQLEAMRAADALAMAELSGRAAAGAHLLRIVNHLVATQLIHMNREETEVMGIFWDRMDDGELAALRNRVMESIPPERLAEWDPIFQRSLSPIERRFLAGPSLG